MSNTGVNITASNMALVWLLPGKKAFYNKHSSLFMCYNFLTFHCYLLAGHPVPLLCRSTSKPLLTEVSTSFRLKRNGGGEAPFSAILNPEKKVNLSREQHSYSHSYFNRFQLPYTLWPRTAELLSPLQQRLLAYMFHSELKNSKCLKDRAFPKKPRS